MKIAVLMPLAEQTGGSEVALTHLMQYGRSSDIHWRVIFLQPGPMVEQFRALGIEVQVIPAHRLRQPRHFLATVLRLASVLRREKIDVVVSWMGKPHLYAAPAAVLAGVPAVWFQHGMASPRSRMDKIVTRLPACGIFTCSRAAAQAQAGLAPARPTHVVYPGVELDRFSSQGLPLPSEMRAKLGLPETGPLIGIVGRMQRWKGIHVLVEAMPEVLRLYPEAHAVVVGGVHDLEPDYPALVEKRIAGLGLGEQVILAGLQRNVPEWMQAMDIVVHASDREPFGIVVIEAMALGKPVIAGNAGGPTEIITDGKDGLLTPYGDAPALAGAILKYLEDPEKAAQMGAAARARAQDFSTERYAANFIEALRSLMPLGRTN